MTSFLIQLIFWVSLIFFILYAFTFIRSYLSFFKFKNLHQVHVYFGIPGSGKTTYAAYLAKQAMYEPLSYRLWIKYPTNPIIRFLFRNCRVPLNVFSNVPIVGTYSIDPKSDLGYYDVSDGKIIIDEASIEYNNRNFKSLPAPTIQFFKLHRHYRTSIDVFSQSFDDMDITLRRLAHSYYLVKKSIFPYFVKVKRIYRKVGIDENTHQIADLFNFGIPFLDDKYIFMPSVWKLFDSYDAPELPHRDFTKWDRTSAAPPAPAPAPASGEGEQPSDPFEQSSQW